MKATLLEAGDFAETVPPKAGVDNSVVDLILLRGWPVKVNGPTEPTVQHSSMAIQTDGSKTSGRIFFLTSSLQEKNVLVSLKSASVMRY